MHSPYARVRPCVCFNLKNFNWIFVHFDIRHFYLLPFFRRDLIFANTEHNNRTLYVKIQTRFCAHFERRLLKINQVVQCYEQKF